VGNVTVTTPLQVPPSTQIVVDGALTVAAPITFAAGAPAIVVLNGSLALLNDVIVRTDGNETRVVLFVVDSGNIDVAANFSASTDAACIDAVADRSVPGEFAVLLVSSEAKSCTGRHGSASETTRWVLVGLGAAACVCAIACVVVVIMAALFAYRFRALRWLYRENEHTEDSIVHSRIIRGQGRNRAV